MRVLVFSANSAVVKQLMLALKKQYAHSRFYCVARNEDKAGELNAILGESLAGLECFDFSDSAKVNQAVEQAKNTLGDIDCVIIGQGFLPDQIATESNLQLIEDCFRVNCLSVMAVLVPVTKILKQQGFGKIAVISSVAGDRGRPRNFTYGAAKSAVSTYLQGLRSTFYSTAIEVYDFKLGPVDTPMTVDHEKNFSFSTAEKVAEIMAKALNKKRYNVYIPGFWRWVMLAVKIMPECLFQRLKFLSAR
jgi:short-subunit dehydrogenase